MAMGKRFRDIRAERRREVKVELTVTVNFGDDIEPVVLLDDYEVPFVDLALEARKNAGTLITSAVLKAATFRPAVMKELILPARLMK